LRFDTRLRAQPQGEGEEDYISAKSNR